GLFVLERPVPARVRLHAQLTVVYVVPLGVAIVLLHLDRFDFAAPVTWGFFAIVGLLSLAALAALRAGGAEWAGEPASGLEAIWLLVAGALLGLWGIALFLAPAT